MSDSTGGNDLAERLAREAVFHARKYSDGDRHPCHYVRICQ